MTPEAVSVASRVTLIGLEVCQPVQEPPSQAMLVVGAVASGVTVKGVGVESRPAPFRAVTSLGSVGSVALASKL